METRKILAFYEENPQFYNLHLKVTNPEKINLDGYKIELLLKWDYEQDDVVFQNWFTSSGDLEFVAEPTEEKNIFKFTVTFTNGTEISHYGPEINTYMYVATFGIRNKDYAQLNKEGSPSLLDENKEMILPAKKSEFSIFPNISLTI